MRSSSKLIRASALVIAAIALAGCATFGQKAPPSAPIRGPMMPPAGKQMLFVAGQPVSLIEDRALWQGEPAGYIVWVQLAKIDPDKMPARSRAGLANPFPDSALQIGLNLEGLDELQRISDGREDAHIQFVLDLLGKSGRPVYLRFGPEFDGEWEHYDPTEFKQAWRYFRGKLAASGYRNIAMVWHSAAYCGGNYFGVPTRVWYPGDDVVDWIGISWFQQVSCDYSIPRSLVQFAREHGKPVMIAEASPQGYDVAALKFSREGRYFESRSARQIWNEWFEPYFDFIDENADVIRIVCYINNDWDAMPMWGKPYYRGYWGDARLQANAYILSHWQSKMRDRRWLKGSPEMRDLLSAGEQ